MACSNPFYRYNKITNSYARIPCGWCMSCRIDKRNYYRDKFEYCLRKEFNSVGSFTCITYDDNHLPLNFDGTIPTLKKSDSVNFIKRVRSYLKYHKIDSPFLKQGFKFFCAGEYGDLGRPHMHYIFCGLDYTCVNELFRSCWKNGVIIDNRPILDGGINYVMKYMDKQQHGSELDEYYDNGVEPPFMHCSHSLAKGLYDTDEDYYEWRNKKRPLPIWVRNSRFIKPDTKPSDFVLQFAEKNNMSYDDADYYLRRSKLLDIEHNAHFNNEPVLATYGDVSRTHKRIELKFFN